MFIETRYKDTTRIVQELLSECQISYEFLWALFKPDDTLHTLCTKTKEPQAVRFCQSKPMDDSRPVHSFTLDCRYIDYNGYFEGEASIELQIQPFSGVRKIQDLNVFPLSYHPQQATLRDCLKKRGEKFLTLRGSHHRFYRGLGIPAKAT